MIVYILICTIDERINEVPNVLLPEINENIFYKISHQYTDEKFLQYPAALNRKDVEISTIKGKGLSKNRNNALKMIGGDVVVMADDDVKYIDGFYDILKKVYADQKVDGACFQIQTLEGEPPYKSYSKKNFEYNPKKQYNVSTVEMTFRTSALKNKNVCFDERFGLGSGMFESGEEDVFLHTFKNNGFRVFYFPYYIVIHPYQSSGKINCFSENKNRTVGAVTKIIYGNFSARLRIIWYVFKKRKELKFFNISPSIYYHQMLQGIKSV